MHFVSFPYARSDFRVRWRSRLPPSTATLASKQGKTALLHRTSSRAAPHERHAVRLLVDVPGKDLECIISTFNPS